MANATAVVQANIKVGEDLINVYAETTAELLSHLADLAALAPDLRAFTTAIKTGTPVAQPGYNAVPQHAQQAQATPINQVAYSNPNGGAPQWSQPQQHAPAPQGNLDSDGNPLPGWVKPCPCVGQYGPMKFVSRITNGKKWSAYGCPAPKDANTGHGLQFEK